MQLPAMNSILWGWEEDAAPPHPSHPSKGRRWAQLPASPPPPAHTSGSLCPPAHLQSRSPGKRWQELADKVLLFPGDEGVTSCRDKTGFLLVVAQTLELHLQGDKMVNNGHLEKPPLYLEPRVKPEAVCLGL